MRLIKADEVKKAFIGNRYGTKAIEYIIDNVPTVKAIPVEWIKDKMDELEGTGRFEFSEYLDELLADWEKENG